jgi:Zn finger protein HypA/HybF involved in hydrogenase expression
MPEEDVVYTSFATTREEPGEHDVQCPECGSADVEEMTDFFCRGCEDVQVSDDGDYCSECHGAMAEARRDAMLDNQMEGF